MNKILNTVFLLSLFTVTGAFGNTFSGKTDPSNRGIIVDPKDSGDFDRLVNAMGVISGVDCAAQKMRKHHIIGNATNAYLKYLMECQCYPEVVDALKMVDTIYKRHPTWEGNIITIEKQPNNTVTFDMTRYGDMKDNSIRRSCS